MSSATSARRCGSLDLGGGERGGLARRRRPRAARPRRCGARGTAGPEHARPPRGPGRARRRRRRGRTRRGCGAYSANAVRAPAGSAGTSIATSSSPGRAVVSGPSKSSPPSAACGDERASSAASATGAPRAGRRGRPSRRPSRASASRRGRRGGRPGRAAASARATSVERSSAAWRTVAPIRSVPSLRRSTPRPAIGLMSTSRAARATRRLSSGIRLCPPASTRASSSRAPRAPPRPSARRRTRTAPASPRRLSRRRRSAPSAAASGGGERGERHGRRARVRVATVRGACRPDASSVAAIVAVIGLRPLPWRRSVAVCVSSSASSSTRAGGRRVPRAAAGQRRPGLLQRVEDHWSARQTFSAVNGGSTWRPPRASASALATAAGAPIVPPSAIPLTPSGFSGDGVSTNSVANSRDLGRGQERVVEQRRQRLAVLVAATSSVRHAPRPWTAPPITWPSASSGLTIRPGVVDRDELAHAHLARRALDLDRPPRTRREAKTWSDSKRARPGAAARAGRRPPRRPRSRPSRSSGSRTSRRRRASASVSPVTHRHALRVDAEPVGGDLREQRLVALAGRHRADRDEHLAVVVADRRVLEQPARALDAQRDAGADEHLGPLGPRPARRRVAGARRGAGAGSSREQLERAVQAALEVARVVGPAERGPVRERADRLRRRSSTGSIPSSRAAASIVGLDQVARLGPAGAAVGRGRDLVRARAGDDDLDGLDVVAARRAASPSCAAGSACSAAGRRRGRPAAGRAARGSGRRRRARARPPRAARGPAARRAGSRAGPRPT